MIVGDTYIRATQVIGLTELIEGSGIDTMILLDEAGISLPSLAQRDSGLKFAKNSIEDTARSVERFADLLGDPSSLRSPWRASAGRRKLHSPPASGNACN
jgi:hypothetical protein